MSNGQRGMTLVELLAGMTILGLVALGATLILGNSIGRNQLSLHRTIAAGLASSRTHLLASMPFQPQPDFANYRIGDEQVAAGPPAVLTAAEGKIPGHPDFSRTVTLRYNEPVPGMLLARTEVFWHHHGTVQKLHTSVTFLHSGLELAF